ncbi:MAG: RsbRD N-terminal domain-containing protein [Deltaproteobacteria bacterium]|nr:RsbRD N-terminal domain-containing protein [Deltaproteobacteria bacterium]
MALIDLLTKKKSVIVSRWFDAVLESYPQETATFMKSQKNRFANPVGCTLAKEVEDVYSALLKGSGDTEIVPFLDNIVRIRAVQDFSASAAVSFVFLLKRVVRQELGKEIKQNDLTDELLAFESQVDKLALLSFDIYMSCREKIYEIRVNEARSNVHMLLRKAKLICDDPDSDSEVG